MLKRLYTTLCSLSLGLWLLAGVMLALAVGSFSRASSEGGGLNEMPLFYFLKEAPLSFSWWLWICVALIALLCVNALLCSIEALRKKGRSIAPHLMHAGFLLVVIAHLISAFSGFKQQMQLTEGGSIGFPDGERVQVERINFEMGQMGMMKNYRAELRVGGAVKEVQPNQPVFHKGFGIYLKHVELTPAPVAIVEIHREPGAMAALLGALLFTAGNVMLLARRKGK
ncbi:MAG TPA: cytochrome C biogenesis protein ResB [Geobacter sp.]|nr:cytochrome C biogenesis protein ResB [Geobacter sp.]